MIAIIGGYGAVGAKACQLLQKWGKQPLKIGGRNPEKAKNDYAALFPDAQWEQVDVQHDENMRNFIKGSKLVVNCAGPSHSISERITRICISEGCHLVDAGFERKPGKTEINANNLVILYAAGATPGLSGMFPRWFAQQFEKVTSLLAYIGALDTFTPTGAKDYLEGVLDETNSPLACWKNGALCKGVLKRASHVRLPFFPRELSTYPIFDSETHFVAKNLDISNGEWYCTVDGNHIANVLDTAGTLYKTAPKEAIDKLCLATALDMAGRDAYFNMLVQMEGISEDRVVTRTALMETRGVNQVTGSVAAACAIAALEGRISPGIRPAASADNVSFIVDLLIESGAIGQVRIFKHPVSELLLEEEGVL